MVDKGIGYNLPKAEDTIYQRHYVSGEKLSRLLGMKDTVGYNNPTVDKAIHSGAEVSIDTQSEEERMRMQQVMESSE